uniref:Transmembrane protein 223like [Bombyx mori] n=1 Tax=Lepeophtheirus salmonis TaxID=72036 RepID=A0A0K2SXI8_LEPSM
MSFYHRIFRRLYHYKPKDRHVLSEPVPELVNKDYILFKCEEPRIRLKSIVATICLPLWGYLGYFALSIPSTIIEPYAKQFKKGDKNSWVIDTVASASQGVGIAFGGFGIGLTTYWFLRTGRTIRRVVLRKGGKYVTLVTYGLLGIGSKYSTVPITHCSTVKKTFLRDTKIFLNLKDHYLKFQLNIEQGFFVNKPLFDRTVGISRKV